MASNTDAGTHCWFWIIWGDLLPSKNWGYRLSVPLVGSKCDAGIFLRWGYFHILIFIATLVRGPAPLISEMSQANALLKKNLENAKASLEVLVADLQFLRDQQTITQVK